MAFKTSSLPPLIYANLPRGGGGGVVAIVGAEDLVNDGELVEVVQGEVGGEDDVLGTSAAKKLTRGAGWISTH